MLYKTTAANHRMASDWHPNKDIDKIGGHSSAGRARLVELGHVSRVIVSNLVLVNFSLFKTL